VVVLRAVRAVVAQPVGGLGQLAAPPLGMPPPAVPRVVVGVLPGVEVLPAKPATRVPAGTPNPHHPSPPRPQRPRRQAGWSLWPAPPAPLGVTPVQRSGVLRARQHHTDPVSAPLACHQHLRGRHRPRGAVRHGG
jgi:hypothetical protein